MSQLAKSELETLREAESKRLEALEAEEDARELEELKLAAQLVSEGAGVRGKDFEVVNTSYGVFALRKPDARGIAQWDKAMNAKAVSTDQLAGILRNYIIPEGPAQIEFHKVASERPGIVNGMSDSSVGGAFLKLIGFLRSDAKKK